MHTSLTYSQSSDRSTDSAVHVLKVCWCEQAVDHPYLVLHNTTGKHRITGVEPATKPVQSMRDTCAICQDQITATEVLVICQGFTKLLPTISIVQVAAAACKHCFHPVCLQEYIASVRAILLLVAFYSLSQAPNEDGIGCPACFQPLSVDFRPAVESTAINATQGSDGNVVTFGKSSILHDVDLSTFQSSTKVLAHTPHTP